MKQCTDTILMVRPVCFGYNEETAIDNHYQKRINELSTEEIQNKALQEFDELAVKLAVKDINVIVVEDTPSPRTTDAIFPNNWISFHDGGQIVWYPMQAVTRRGERRADIIGFLKNDHNLKVKEIHDLSIFESENTYLEGTGSLVLDRVKKIAYAALSARTHSNVLAAFCEKMDYEPVTFNAFQTAENERLSIYHTNVMMSVGDTFAIICLEAIDDKKERKKVVKSLKQTNKEIIEISESQCNQFAGNMLQIASKNDKSYLAMSTAAFNSLDEAQISKIKKHCDIIHSSLETIETLGGGSARCMMAEVFLQPNH